MAPYDQSYHGNHQRFVSYSTLTYPMNSYGDYHSENRSRFSYTQSDHNGNNNTTYDQRLDDDGWNRQPRTAHMVDDERFASSSWYDNQKASEAAYLSSASRPVQHAYKTNRANDFCYDELCYGTERLRIRSNHTCDNSIYNNDPYISNTIARSPQQICRIQKQEIVTKEYRLGKPCNNDHSVLHRREYYDEEYDVTDVRNYERQCSNDDQQYRYDLNCHSCPDRWEHCKDTCNGTELSNSNENFRKDNSPTGPNRLTMDRNSVSPPLLTGESDNVSCYDDVDYQQRRFMEHSDIPISLPGAYNSKSAAKKEATLIEMEPGHFERLRGAAETYDAVKHDFYVPVDCIGCNKTIFCIQDATYVCCPYATCLVIGPNFNRVINDGDGGGGGGGVGIGLTFNDLAIWQADILRETTAILKKQSVSTKIPPRSGNEIAAYS